MKKSNNIDSPKFIPGLKLNRMFYKEVIGPLIKKYFPKLKYAAALTGHGSDVIGFDNPTSMDHNWGPRMDIFLQEKDFDKQKSQLDEMFRKFLPYTFKGFSTNYSNIDPKAYLKQTPVFIDSGEVNHYVRFYTVNSFLHRYVRLSLNVKIKPEDWLTIPQQPLLEITTGEIFHDTLGELKKMHSKFEYYPKDVWFYIMRTQWQRISHDMAFQARSGDRGDEIGSLVMAAHLVELIMEMCFFMERKYAPYKKWFGSAFLRLKNAKRFTPLLKKILHSDSWKERQQILARCYSMLAQEHNKLNITKKVDITLTDYHGRGYDSLDIGPIIASLDHAIKDPKLKQMKNVLGSIDQFLDRGMINLDNYVYKEFKNIIK